MRPKSAAVMRRHQYKSSRSGLRLCLRPLNGVFDRLPPNVLPLHAYPVSSTISLIASSHTAPIATTTTQKRHRRIHHLTISPFCETPITIPRCPQCLACHSLKPTPLVMRSHAPSCPGLGGHLCMDRLPSDPRSSLGAASC